MWVLRRVKAFYKIFLFYYIIVMCIFKKNFNILYRKNVNGLNLNFVLLLHTNSMVFQFSSVVDYIIAACQNRFVNFHHLKVGRVFSLIIIVI